MTSIRSDEVESNEAIEGNYEDNAKRKVTHACINCKKSHLSCDSARPCKRCIGRNIGDSCADGERKKRGRKKMDEKEVDEIDSKSRKSNKGKNKDQLMDMNQMPFQPGYLPIMMVNSPHMMSAFQPTLPTEPMYGRPYFNPFQPIQTYTVPSPSYQQIHPSFMNNNGSLTSPRSIGSRENGEEIMDPLRNDLYVDTPFNLHSLSEASSRNVTIRKSDSQEKWYTGADPYKMVDEAEEKLHCDAANRKAEELGWLGAEVKDYSEASKTARLYRKKLGEILQIVNADQLDQMKKEFDIHLNNFKTSSAQMDVPSIIWERYGIIQHVNQAFVDLTGFCEKLPTQPERLLLMEMFMFPSFEETKATDVNEQFFGSTEDNQIMMPAHVRVWKNRKKFNTIFMGKNKDEFMEGTLCLTVKRDVLNLPILFYAHFLPSPNALNVRNKNS